MRTIPFIFGSENRQKIMKALLDYPKRQWSCSSMEDVTKLPHATVFRTIKGLVELGLLTQAKVNRRDLVFMLAESPMVAELSKALQLERSVNRHIAQEFTNKIQKIKGIAVILLYGSTVHGELRPDSDIDILVVVNKHGIDNKIHDIAAEISLKTNKTIAVMVMDKNEFQKEKNKQFLISVKDKHEVLHGKEPF